MLAPIETDGYNSRMRMLCGAIMILAGSVLAGLTIIGEAVYLGLARSSVDDIFSKRLYVAALFFAFSGLCFVLWGAATELKK